MASFREAFNLIFSGDAALYEIIGLTLLVSIASTSIAALFGIFFGMILGKSSFPGRKIVVGLVNTLMGLPPVVAGLIVYLLLSRSGPLGFLHLLYTPKAMVIAQVLLITPIICGLVLSTVSVKKIIVEENCRGLRLSGLTSRRLLLHECRRPIYCAVLAGYGRAISEVGAIMIVGGNIAGKTRVMTTAIVLETSKGYFDIAVALGIVLLLLALIVNLMVMKLTGGTAE